jgi:ABC-type nitrate/sulfonate/bicarbonate transport system substrate-binding protein
MKKKRQLRAARMAVIGASLLTLTLVAACSSGGGGSAATGSGSASAGPVPTVKLAVQIAASHFPLTLAHTLGFDKKNGINIQIVPFSDTTSITEALLSGQVDAAPESPVPNGAGMIAKGAPVTCISLYATGGNRNALITGSPDVKTASDLIGKKVGVEVGGVTEMALDRYLEAGNVPLSKVDIVNLSFADTAAAVTTGQVAAAEFNQPGLSKTLASDKSAHILAWGSQFIAAPGCIYVSTAFAKTPAAYGLYVSLQEAFQYMRVHGFSSEVMSDMTSFLKTDAATAKLSFSGVVEDSRISTWVVSQNQSDMQWAKQHGTITAVPTTGQMYDVSLQTKAAKQYPNLFSDLPAYLKAQGVPTAQQTSSLYSGG